eukprot:CAMPEP_0182838122 /NCGR_PEP_ID=MMETSP0006_2-20121128/23122_1 /TAXON_ID=97485 /ORGANISM="Prymnesium parvum, Strain Texoma1" /LENGTH=277 /DNA_ID=CAMNT_0024967099 /DNA_START=138 /DNA_END=971 /DNA_ORIENTATION=-
MDAVDCDVRRVNGGLHFNSRLAAPNVWEIDVDQGLVDAAGSIFECGTPFKSVTEDGEPYEEIATSVGSFFLQRINWKSDACWISVDDREAFDAFSSIFTRMGLAEHFAPLFPDGVRLYSAFYVVRSECSAHNFHVDYKPEVGADAMTLITPLRDFKQTDNFQLSYVAHRGGMLQKEGLLDEGEPGSEIRRYEYKKGKAIVFASKFMHSTEPGAGYNGEPHAYLCFTFGTTNMDSWAQISRTLGTQSRVVVRPDGDYVLTALGERIEEILRMQRDGRT